LFVICLFIPTTHANTWWETCDLELPNIAPAQLITPRLNCRDVVAKRHFQFVSNSTSLTLIFIYGHRKSSLMPGVCVTPWFKRR